MGTPRKVTVPKRREIYFVRFDPAEGSEIRKTRPALILQNDVSNRFSPVTIVAALSSKFDPGKLYPTEVILSAGKDTGLSAPSVVLLNQIRTVDKHRLLKRLGVVSNATMAKVDRALQISLGLLPLK
jgi:mRNA interferase MazF